MYVCAYTYMIICDNHIYIYIYYIEKIYFNIFYIIQSGKYMFHSISVHFSSCFRVSGFCNFSDAVNTDYRE